MIDRMNLMDVQQMDRVVSALGFVDLPALLKAADEEMDEAKLKEYCARAKMLQPMVKRELAIMLSGIVSEVARKAQGVDQIIFWRGGINILDNLLDRVQELVDRDTEFNKPTTPPQHPHQVISPVGEISEGEVM